MMCHCFHAERLWTLLSLWQCKSCRAGAKTNSETWVADFQNKLRIPFLYLFVDLKPKV